MIRRITKYLWIFFLVIGVLLLVIPSFVPDDIQLPLYDDEFYLKVGLIILTSGILGGMIKVFQNLIINILILR